MFFPLYDNLKKNKTKKALSRDDKARLVDKISQLDQDGQHRILALILYHQLQNGTVKIQIKSSIDITLNNLPAELQVILELFCSLHINLMKEQATKEAFVV